MTTLTYIEFDHVFTVTDDGRVQDAPGIYVPEVWHSETDDIEIMGGCWEALTGWTGQYGYRGACMHASEVFAGNLEQYVLSEPGTYVLVVVDVLPDDEAEYPEPAGWAVLRMV